MSVGPMRIALINLLGVINDEKTEGRLIYQPGSYVDKVIRDARKLVIATRVGGTPSENAMEDAKIGE